MLGLSSKAAIMRACDCQQLFAQPVRIVASQTKRRCKNARLVFTFFMHNIE